MRYLLCMTLLFFSLSACSKEEANVLDVNKNGNSEVKSDSKVDKKVKVEAPCDSKEDLLKKLAEKQKTESEKSETEKVKGFKLQGGDTGCSVK